VSWIYLGNDRNHLVIALPLITVPPCQNYFTNAVYLYFIHPPSVLYNFRDWEHLTVEAWVQSNTSPCWICGEQSGTETGFPASTFIFHHQYHSTNTIYLYFILLPSTLFINTVYFYILCSLQFKAWLNKTLLFIVLAGMILKWGCQFKLCHLW
jgi:hypothetical protein